jgi:hypothetical protein
LTEVTSIFALGIIEVERESTSSVETHLNMKPLLVASIKSGYKIGLSASDERCIAGIIVEHTHNSDWRICHPFPDMHGFRNQR